MVILISSVLLFHCLYLEYINCFVILTVYSSESEGIGANFYIAEVQGFTSYSKNTTDRFAYFPNLPVDDLFVISIVAANHQYGYGAKSPGFSQRIRRMFSYNPFLLFLIPLQHLPLFLMRPDLLILHMMPLSYVGK